MIQRRNALRKKSARKPKKTSPVQRKTSSSLSNQVLPQRAQTPLPTVLQSMQILTNIPSPPTILNAQALRSIQKQVATNPPTRSRRRITLSLPLSHNHKRPTPFNPRLVRVRHRFPRHQLPNQHFPENHPTFPLNVLVVQVLVAIPKVVQVQAAR